LKSATYPGQTTESYSYDAAGNRTSSHRSATHTYQPFNKLVSTSTASYTYDNNGNLLTKTDATGTWQYRWDYENRMTQATRPDGVTVSYKYDALGRRVQRTPSNAASTNYIYDGEEVVKDSLSDGTTVDYWNGLGVDNKIRQVRTPGRTFYYLQDHLGSTRALTEANGSVFEQMTYDSFGDSAGSVRTRYGYTGRERDELTGLYYYRARWYDPQVGRFISEDPIGFGGGANWYAYVANSPLNFSDPSGLCPEKSERPTRCDLELRVSRIPTTLYLGLHAYVLVRQAGTSDVPSYYSARPNAEDQLEAGHGSYNPDSPDYESEPSASVLFSASGPCEDIIRSFNETEYFTNRSGIKYGPFSNNSNAYIYTLLNRAGLDPDGLSSELFATSGFRTHSGNSSFPGWGRLLSFR
jgi:RHS repeat-associated protein